jgi:deoxyribodipyrimidine photolyase-related protein
MPERRASVWITGDQLLVDHPAVLAAEAEYGRTGLEIVMIETRARRRRLPYHPQKQVLLLSAMRHFAADLRRRGYRVDYRSAPNLGIGLADHLRESGSTRLLTMAASEYRARQFQHQLSDSLAAKTPDSPVSVAILPNTQFLTGQFNPCPTAQPGKRVVMENFYREMRRHFGVLMEPDGLPSGGRWNFDEENRKPLPARIALPEPSGWEPDEITLQVMDELTREGVPAAPLTGFRWAVTRAQAHEALDLFINQRLADFGPYEDAMTSRSATLFHSLLSPCLNLGLLDPLLTIRAAEKAWREGRAPLNSVEGFIRQILGWREFIYWQYWQQMPMLATANHWQAVRPLPEFFWNGQTEMNCLRKVIDRVLTDGYSHHIERLMVICNYCLLAGIEPRQVADWFNALYIDAFDWVVLPNVIGMGLNADGGRTATKPYIASANYINRMSDYCRDCRYDQKARTGPTACPFNRLYWNFLLENETVLRANPRLGPAVLGLKHLDQAERQRIRDEVQNGEDGLFQSPP